jgi:hypothetical protein
MTAWRRVVRCADCGLQALDEAGVAEVVEFHPEASETALPRFLSEGRRFDLAFVDGNHRFDSVFLDLVYLGRLVRPGGIVFVEDDQLPSIRRATSFCATNLGWRIEQTSTDDDLHHWPCFARRQRHLPDRSIITSLLGPRYPNVDGWGGP